MDAKHFDQVAKAVGQGTARRRLLAGLLGAVLTGSLDRVTGSAKGKSKRQHHRRHRLQAQKGDTPKGNSPNAKRCQKGDWATLARADAPTVPFASEEECVSYGAQGGTIVDAQEPVNPCAGQPDGTCCNGATGGTWCQAGECVAVPASGTIQQCQGACALGGIQRGVPVCGVTMTCPSCLACLTGVAPCASWCGLVGPFDTGTYCMRQLAGTPSCVFGPCTTGQCCNRSSCVELCVP